MKFTRISRHGWSSFRDDAARPLRSSLVYFDAEKGRFYMLKVPLSRIAAVTTARSARELRVHLQGALELKYAVIPAYLTALFSLRDGANTMIREILHGTVVDEMLHVALVANILNAIGCSPILSGQRLVFSYPARLPLDATGVEVGLKKFSLELVRDVFMALNRRGFRARGSRSASAADRPSTTVDQFYGAIIGKFEELGDQIFVGDPALQFVDGISYSERELFQVTDAASAIRALRLVSGERDIGFGRSARSRRVDKNVSGQWRDAFDPAGVIDIVENSRAAMYAPGSPVRAAVDTFNLTYCSILAALNDAFNGRPERYEFAVSSMYQLTSLARSIVTIDRGDGTFAAPSFEWAD
jgi:hypothetical protein